MNHDRQARRLYWLTIIKLSAGPGGYAKIVHLIPNAPSVRCGPDQDAVPGKADLGKPTWTQRFDMAWQSARQIVGKVWLYVVVGIAVGAGIHGYVPESALVEIMGKNARWSVPAAVLVGVTLYSNAAGIMPVVSSLMEKGAALGTVLAAVIGPLVEVPVLIGLVYVSLWLGHKLYPKDAAWQPTKA